MANNHESTPEKAAETVKDVLDVWRQHLDGEDAEVTDEKRAQEVKRRDIESEIDGLQAEREDLEAAGIDDESVVRRAQELGRAQLEAEVEREQIPPVEDDK